jgi:hypothetical protein
MRTTLAALVAPFLLAVAAQAQPVADHLNCYKVKDSQAKTTYTADLGGLIAEPGCIIKVPGSLFCTQATKTNIAPTPPGGADDTGPAGRFLCYKVKCHKSIVAPFQWHDQFGDRQLAPSTPKLLCAPEILPTTTTTTTTGAASTTTTTLATVGTACTSGTECTSGFCVDGVCCSTACTGVCAACSAAKRGEGTDGSCGDIVLGLDPDNECASMAPSTCGTTGVCDGAGACQLYAAGTTCAAPSCIGGVQAGAGTCDGSGTCDPGPMSPCSPYVCGANACMTSCASNADCAAGFTCSGGACQ